MRPEARHDLTPRCRSRRSRLLGDDRIRRMRDAGALLDGVFRFALLRKSGGPKADGRGRVTSFTTGTGGNRALSSATGRDPYQSAARRPWRAPSPPALGTTRLRRDKPLPDFADRFRLVATWDAYRVIRLGRQGGAGL